MEDQSNQMLSAIIISGTAILIALWKSWESLNNKLTDINGKISGVSERLSKVEGKLEGRQSAEDQQRMLTLMERMAKESDSRERQKN